MMNDSKKMNGGFSLIELSIVMVIVGLAMATSMQLYKQMSFQRSASALGYHGEVIRVSISNFLYQNKRLPCPAIPGLPPDDPKAGKENCLAASAPLSSCVTNGFCKVAGGRDTKNAPSGNDPVYIGAVPYVTLNIPERVSLDAWGNKLLYAVTQPMTIKPGASVPFNVYRGSITELSYDQGMGGDTKKLEWSPKSEFSAAPALCAPDPPFTPAGGTVVTTFAKAKGYFCPSSTPIIVLSHGKNGIGAYTSEGILHRTCTGNTGTEIELKNCDGDSAFYNRTHNKGSAAGADFYDDSVLLDTITTQADRWRAGVDSANPDSITAVPAKVGINTDKPAWELDVNGKVKSENILGDKFCDTSGSNCFFPSVIGGTGMSCGWGAGFAGGVAVGLDADGSGNVKLKCNSNFFIPNTKPGTCIGTKRYLVGIGADKTLNCL